MVHFDRIKTHLNKEFYHTSQWSKRFCLKKEIMVKRCVTVQGCLMHQTPWCVPLEGNTIMYSVLHWVHDTLKVELYFCFSYIHCCRQFWWTHLARQIIINKESLVMTHYKYHKVQTNLCRCICKDGSTLCFLHPRHLLPDIPNTVDWK